MKSVDFLYDHPIPGASLTNSPDNKLPFERPPKFSNPDSALRYLWKQLADMDYQLQVVDFLQRGMTVADLATVIAKVGVYQGMWNTDVSLLIYEPLIYMIMQIAYDNKVDYMYSSQVPTTVEGYVENKRNKYNNLKKKSDEQIAKRSMTSGLVSKVM